MPLPPPLPLPLPPPPPLLLLLCVPWASENGPSLTASPAPAVQLELALRPLRVCQRVFPKIPGYRKPDNTLFCAGGQCGAAAGGMQQLP